MHDRQVALLQQCDQFVALRVSSFFIVGWHVWGDLRVANPGVEVTTQDGIKAMCGEVVNVLPEVA